MRIPLAVSALVSGFISSQKGSCGPNFMGLTSHKSQEMLSVTKAMKKRNGIEQKFGGV